MNYLGHQWPTPLVTLAILDERARLEASSVCETSDSQTALPVICCNCHKILNLVRCKVHHSYSGHGVRTLSMENPAQVCYKSA